MDHDILRKIMEVFSQENTRLKTEITALRKQLNLDKMKTDDKLIADILDKSVQKKPKKQRTKKQTVQIVEPVQDPTVSQPATVEEIPSLPPKGRPRKIRDRGEYQKAYQAAYRAKKKAEKESKMDLKPSEQQ